MKKLFTLLATVTLSVMLFAQAPQSFSYQTVIRDASWQVLSNQNISLEISIIEDVANGTAIYTESHSATTNELGLVNLSIGDGGVMSGSWSNIDWGNHTYFIEVAVDVTGGVNYIVMGTTQLRSVPYALYAETSGSSTPGPQGVQGIQGLPGDTGAVGPQGPIGLTGATGPPGNDGADGNDGAVGATGPAGANGIDGNDGAVGATGPQGLQGVPGNDGTNGINGIDGIDGVNGAQGPIGLTGAQGIQGIAGLNGTNSVCGFSIGDTAFGGIIFYLDATGCHGLVAKPTDEGSFILCSIGTLDIRCLATGIYAGAQNTKKIIAMTAYWNTIYTNTITCPAAMVCDTLSYGGYSDWYLPSKEELDLLYVNLHLQGLGVFNSGAYISSSEWESDDSYHYATYFYNHFYNHYQQKGAASNVRAVRAF